MACAQISSQKNWDILSDFQTLCLENKNVVSSLLRTYVNAQINLRKITFAVK